MSAEMIYRINEKIDTVREMSPKERIELAVTAVCSVMGGCLCGEILLGLF